jgi:hypothetical protein
MPNPYDSVVDTAIEFTMKEHEHSPPVPIVDHYRVMGDGIAAITGQQVPPEKWMVWFVFLDDRALRLAQSEKCRLIARTMRESLTQGGFPGELADQVDIRFSSHETIDKAGGVPRFIYAAIAPRIPFLSGFTGDALKATFLSPASMLGWAGFLVALLGDRVGLPEWLRWSVAAALLVPSTILHYRQRREGRRQVVAGLAQAAQALGFREVPDPKALLGSLGLLRARAFRGHRIRWGLERASGTGKTILAGAQIGSVGDEMTHHLVACWSLAGSPLPDFDLRPETLGGRVASALGGQDIDFDTNPTFSARYRLRAGDEQAVRRVFRPEVLNFFVRDGEDEIWTEGWHAEARDGWLIVHRPHPMAEVAAQLLPEYLGRTQELFDLLTARR